ncbi:MAG: hypothetical protein M3Z15_05810 [Pseudomonadota bacterium]|nr:hypothetical protein [Pseudomonadota bacterium]
MLNRILSLLVAIAAPASAFAMLYVGAHPAGVVTLAERAPCLGLAILAITLGTLHARAATDRAAALEAGMWWALSLFLLVAAIAAPHLGLWVILALLWMAGTSIVRLAGRMRGGRMAASPFRRRIFA